MYNVEHINRNIFNENDIISDIESKAGELFKGNLVSSRKTYEDIKSGYKEELERCKGKTKEIDIYIKIYVDALNYIFYDYLENEVIEQIEGSIVGTSDNLHIYYCIDNYKADITYESDDLAISFKELDDMKYIDNP